MSTQAAATLAQIIPVLWLALVVEGVLSVNPELRGRRRLVPALLLSVAYLWMAGAEYRLILAVVDDEPMPHAQQNFLLGAFFVGAGMLLMPAIATAFGLDPVERFRRSEEARTARVTRRAEKKAARAAEKASDEPRHAAE